VPDDAIPQKPKHVASDKTDINLVVTDGTYFLPAIPKLPVS